MCLDLDLNSQVTTDQNSYCHSIADTNIAPNRVTSSVALQAQKAAVSRNLDSTDGQFDIASDNADMRQQGVGKEIVCGHPQQPTTADKV